MKGLITRLVLFLVFISVEPSMAQTGSVKGQVRTSDGAPAEFVSVGISGTSKGAIANAKGEYEIKNIQPGNYTLKISLVGLAPREQQVEVKANEVSNIPVVTLEENSQTFREVVVSASPNRYNRDIPSATLRLNTPLQEVPQNIQLVSEGALKDQQIISMSDGVVRNVSGTARVEHWGDLYTNIVSRGSQVQAFRNGFNVVNSYWGPLTEDMSFVDHIEFVKGPAGFMLSSGDPSGLYNVVTKKPTGVNKGEASITMGSFNLMRSTLDLDGKLSKDGRFLYRLNMSGQFKNSHRANEYNNRYVIAPVFSYKLDEKTLLTFEYNYQMADMSNVGSFYAFSTNGYGTLPVEFTSLPSGTPGTKINDHSFYLNLQHDLSKTWKITAQAGHYIYNQEGHSMWPSSIDSAGRWVRNIGIWDAESRMTMGQVFVNGDVTTGAVRHRILTGVDMAGKDYIADWGQSHDLDSANAPFDPLNPDLGVPVMGYPHFDRSTPLKQRATEAGGLMDMKYSSIYFQDELGFLENKIRLTLAGRYTILQQSDYGGKPDSADHFTPRVGLSVTVTKDLSVYALYDQSFVPQSGKLSNGDKVQPITGNNMEIGVKRSWMDGRWSSTLAVYTITKNNELTADPTAPTTAGLSVELGQKKTQGLEIDIHGRITNGLNVIANYAYTDSKVSKVTEGITFIEKGDIVPGFAKHTFNVWLNYRLQNGPLKGLGFNAGTSYLADRATYWEAAPSADLEMEDYVKVDAGISWENEKINISANMFNVLNEYLYSGSYNSWMSTPAYSWQTEAPRNVRLSVNYKF